MPDAASRGGKLTLAEMLEILAGGRLPLRFTAYDGSSAGPPDAPLGLELKTPRGTTYLATGARRPRPGPRLHRRRPRDPRRAPRRPVRAAQGARRRARLHAAAAARRWPQIIRSIGIEHLRPIAPPPQEAPPRWRRVAEGLRHSKSRDAEAIHHHYDVSNTFYEWVLGPSMTYTCACYPDADASLDEAQENKYRLVFEKLRLQAGRPAARRRLRLGRHGALRRAPRRPGHRRDAVGGADRVGAAGHRRRGAGRARRGAVRRLPRHRREPASTRSRRSACSSTSACATTRRTSRSCSRGCAPGGLLLNHCITRPDNRSEPAARGFIDRYVFPDGELTGSGRIITEAQDAGLEVLHEENLRRHYALTLRDWCANLVEHWDEAVAEVGLPTAKVWGLYMAGSRLAFETQRHPAAPGARRHGPTSAAATGDLPLRPWWTP